MQNWLPLLLGMAVLPALAFLGFKLFGAVSVHVQEEEAVLVERFGQRVATLREPGLHWLPSRILPWVQARHVSLRRDFLQLKDVHVTDMEGTSVMVDLWIDYRIKDPARATYSVEHLEESMRSLVVHSATSVLGKRSFWQILGDRSELAERLKQDISADTERWGVCIELAFVQKVSLVPEVSARILESIGARLGRAQADILESARLAVAELEANTSAEAAALVGEAKGQYPTAIGRAMAELSRVPGVLQAYNELYRLSVLRPHRATAFVGFGDVDVSAVEAAMIPTHPEGSEA